MFPINDKLKKLKPITSFVIVLLSIILLIYAITIAEPLVRLVVIILLLKIIDLISYVKKSRSKKRHINFETGIIEG